MRQGRTAAKAALAASAQAQDPSGVPENSATGHGFDRWKAYKHLMWAIATKEKRRFMQGAPPYPSCRAMARAAASKGAQLNDATIFRWVWLERQSASLYREKEEVRIAVATWQGWDLDRLDEELKDALRNNPLPANYALLQAQTKGTGGRRRRAKRKAS